MLIEKITTPAGTYEIHESTGHGKAVNGTKVTSSIQVREYMDSSSYLLLKSISFHVGNAEKRKSAIEKAKKYIETFE